MEKKVYKEIKTEILSINLSDGKPGGIRKKIQGRATKTKIDNINTFIKELGFNSRDDFYNTYLDLTLRFCAPLPTDKPLNADTLFLFNRLIDWELIYQQDIGVARDKDREELKLYFLFMLQPFSDERIKKEDFAKMEKIKKRFNYGRTTFQILDFIISTSFTLNRTYVVKDENSKTINDQFNDIVVNKEEMGPTKGKYNI